MPLAVQSLDNNATPVVYEPPQVIAGETPLRTTCAPPSGSTFPLGVSTVTCTTTDAVARTDACTFTVTVALPPRLSATTFMAFGNSITEGKTAFGAISNSYPVQLARMLTSRYGAQTITVLNRGFGGEHTTQGADRLPDDLSAFRPDVLLLEEGVNDLAGGETAQILPMIDALRDMIRTAKAQRVQVFLATLLPVRANSTKTSAHLVIVEANTRIRQLALSENVRLVDLYVGFAGSPDPYIDVDGLHPTEAGYGRIAELFFEAIRAELEVAHGAASMQLVRSLPPPMLPFLMSR